MQVLPTAYFPPILQMACISQFGKYRLEVKEHFLKQTYRNRCEIYGANGKLKMVVPLKKWRNHTLIEEIEVSYRDDWQILHWRSLTSAYRTSPFFEFFEDDLKPLILNSKPQYLIELNLAMENEICELIGLSPEREKTNSYEAQSPDWRNIISPKNKNLSETVKFPEYIQVFADKFGFIPNLSILDLLFNLGPATKEYLNNIPINEIHG